MPDIGGRRRLAAVVCALALGVAACDDVGASGSEPIDPADPRRPTDGIAVDLGVTDEPCPAAINPDNGCIYLGILSDLSEGPFARLAVPITEAQAAFWRRVNEDGGIGGFDVDVETYTRDTRYDRQRHSELYREIEPHVLALAQTLGTETTLAILSDMDDDDVIAAPASWWSGWDFPERHRGLVLGSGYSYCLESMIALDWLAAERGEVSVVAHIGYPGDYGGDSAVGAQAWAAANGVVFAGAIRTAPNEIVGDQREALAALLGSPADVVLLAVGPDEAAEIVSSAVAQGFEGQFIGSAPTWDPSLLDTPSARAVESRYLWVQPWESLDGVSAAHEAMRAALGDALPDNDGYVFGWIWSYPVKAALEAAVAAGDLTRAGLRGVVDGLVVDYDGALPPRTFGGDPADSAVRSAVIMAPDRAASLGSAPLATGVTGRTADAHAYTTPCSG